MCFVQGLSKNSGWGGGRRTNRGCDALPRKSRPTDVALDSETPGLEEPETAEPRSRQPTSVEPVIVQSHQSADEGTGLQSVWGPESETQAGTQAAWSRQPVPGRGGELSLGARALPSSGALDDDAAEAEGHSDQPRCRKSAVRRCCPVTGGHPRSEGGPRTHGQGLRTGQLLCEHGKGCFSSCFPKPRGFPGSPGDRRSSSFAKRERGLRPQGLF